MVNKIGEWEREQSFALVDIFRRKIPVDTDLLVNMQVVVSLAKDALLIFLRQLCPEQQVLRSEQ